MTVSYQYKVASSTSGGFTRLLFMWRGSLYKLIYRELLLFLLAFDILSILYRNLFTTEQREIFEKMVIYCDTFINLIPLTFILGFYVAYVASRWWQQYEAIPWPDKVMHTISLYIPGNDEHVRIVRRTLMRYLNLTLVLILRSISSAVKKRFPTVDHLTEVGFMTTTEKQMFVSIPSTEYNTYWIPCTWFIHILKDMKENNPKLDSQGLKLIMEEFNEFRSKCGKLWSYDWISIPLVYTQVVTLATYSFFIAAVVGRQYVEHSEKPMQMEIDVYLPIFTILQFFFFMGLLKVAEQLINPFGDDDEDFELNWLIDRHTKVSYLGVDTLMLQRPPLVKDKYFDDSDLVLPYTTAAAVHKKKTHRGSVHFMKIPENQQEMYLPEIIEEEQENGNSNTSTPQKPRNSICHSINDSEPNIKKENFSSTNYRYNIDCIESVKYNNKKYSIESEDEIIVNDFKCRSFTIDPVTNEKNILKRSHCSLTNIPIKRDTDNDNSVKLTNITKHNSWLYSSGKRQAKHINENDNFKRRKSFAVGSNDSSTLGRYSFKWSIRKDSVSDSQWKGIRWRPFPKEKLGTSDFTNFPAKYTKTSNEENNTENKIDDSNQCMYINEAFVSSTTELSSESKNKLRNNLPAESNTQKEIFSKDSESEINQHHFSKNLNQSATLNNLSQDSLV